MSTVISSRCQRLMAQLSTRVAFALLVVGVSGISNSATSQPSPLYRGAPVVALTGTVLPQSIRLSFPTAICAVGDYILVVDLGSDSVLVLLDGISGRVIRRFGGIGKKAAQFGAVSGIACRGHSKVSVLDPSRNELVTYALTSLLASLPISDVSTEKVGLAQETTSAAWTTDSTIVTAGFAPGRRFAQVDQAGRIVNLKPKLLGDTRVPERPRLQAYQSIIAANPSSSSFAAATVYSDQLEIFASDGTLLASLPRPFPFEPSFRIGRNRGGLVMVPNGNTNRIGFTSIATTSHSIFALYSGRSVADAGARMVYAAVVEQIGWDGKRQAALLLDRDVSAIGIDEAGTRLFAVAYDGGPKIIVFKLTTPFSVGRRRAARHALWP